MAKIPSDRPAGSARYNPMARPAAAPPARSAGGAPAAPVGSASGPQAGPARPSHERPEAGLQGDGHPMPLSPAPEPGLGVSPRPALAPLEIPGSPRGPGSPGVESGHASPPSSPFSAWIDLAFAAHDPFGLVALSDDQAGSPARSSGHAKGTGASAAASSHPVAPDSPGTRQLRDLMRLEGETWRAQSQWNGFKLMSPHVADAIQQFQGKVPENVHGILRDSPREHAQIFHDKGRDRLVPGLMRVGTKDSVEVPPDIQLDSAKVNVHSHPYTGHSNSDAPSTADQMVARANPGMEHIVQTPAPDIGETNPYITYSGAVPPRHYTLVPNPKGLPVPPPSPDGEPQFHPKPWTG
jgi:hypothetical protein